MLALLSTSGVATLRRFAAGALASDLGELALGQADARALVVGQNGEIAIGGATASALTGEQANAMSGGRDGFVARVGADLSGARIAYLGTTQSDQIDSLAFLDGQLYAGGRTAGDLAGARRGTTDGFVARLDGATLAVSDVRQFGLSERNTQAVRIAAAPGGGTVLGALGLQRGTLNDRNAVDLTAQTSLREGDQFSVRVNDGVARRISIDAGETLATLADKVRRILGPHGLVTTPASDGGRALGIAAKSGKPRAGR